MSEELEPRKPFSYSFRTAAEKQRESGDIEGTSLDTLFSIRDTLLLMTGGCEVVQREDGVFCEKHGRPILEGGNRCDYLATRFSRSRGEDQSKAGVQQYVNEVLGVRDPKIVKRLTGFDL